MTRTQDAQGDAIALIWTGLSVIIFDFVLIWVLAGAPTAFLSLIGVFGMFVMCVGASTIPEGETT